MITESVVRELAKKLQTSEGNILREYVQHLFLSALYQKPNSNHLYFKGGTALRILYGSPRFSEDLHFSAGFKSSKSLESLLLATLTEIEREGIHAGVLEAKTTSGGYLAIVECSQRERLQGRNGCNRQ
jgi:predicted nucleotidyltransferase component of viral defense system